MTEKSQQKEQMIEELLALGIYKIGDVQLYEVPLEDLEHEYNEHLRK
ncbi:Fur-regulated basic protein FbpA [Bacillus shivajii]|nr:Fur-regulated basic protein FbpA [Bacillus shivajii]UCZ53125.1 Fur-regulated basic protein FbpA [Bacillus shivajii]